MKFARIVAPTGAGKSRAISRFIQNEGPGVEVIDILEGDTPETRQVRGPVVILDSTSSNPESTMNWLDHFRQSEGRHVQGVLLIGQTDKESHWTEVKEGFIYDFAIDLDEYIQTSLTARVRRLRGAIENGIRTLAPTASPGSKV